MIWLLLGAALLAGCSASVTIGGGSHTVDPARMADTISRQLRDKIPDAGVRSVVCPKGVKLADGVTFQCTANVEGAQLPIKVTLSHVNTDKGEYDYNFGWTKALIDTDETVKEIQSRLPVQAADAAVDCGTPRVRVVEVGGTIKCTISQGSKRGVVHVVVDDVDGTIHFEPANVWSVTRPKVFSARAPWHILVRAFSTDACVVGLYDAVSGEELEHHIVSGESKTQVRRSGRFYLSAHADGGGSCDVTWKPGTGGTTQLPFTFGGEGEDTLPFRAPGLLRITATDIAKASDPCEVKVYDSDNGAEIYSKKDPKLDVRVHASGMVWVRLDSWCDGRVTRG